MSKKKNMAMKTPIAEARRMPKSPPILRPRGLASSAAMVGREVGKPEGESDMATRRR